MSKVALGMGIVVNDVRSVAGQALSVKVSR